MLKVGNFTKLIPIFEGMAWPQKFFQSYETMTKFLVHWLDAIEGKRFDKPLLP